MITHVSMSMPQKARASRCRCLGCRDGRCALCAQCQYRRCVGHFDGKYLAGDMLKAKCGAEIRVEVRDRVTGDVVDDGSLSHVQLEVRCCAALDAQAAAVILSMPGGHTLQAAEGSGAAT